MPLQVGGVTVVDDSRNLVNITNQNSFGGKLQRIATSYLGPNPGAGGIFDWYPDSSGVIVYKAYQIVIDYYQISGGTNWGQFSLLSNTSGSLQNPIYGSYVGYSPNAGNIIRSPNGQLLPLTNLEGVSDIGVSSAIYTWIPTQTFAGVLASANAVSATITDTYGQRSFPTIGHYSACAQPFSTSADKASRGIRFYQGNGVCLITIYGLLQ